MNILVTGCNGQLGNEIQILQCQHPEHTYFNTDIQSEAEGVQNYSRLDITDKSEVRAFVMDNAIDCVVNCAAYTAVDLAESNRELCATLNALAPAYLAEAVDKRGGFIIHISTDYVFDGTANKPYTEEDTVCPDSVYGDTKCAGEIAVQQCTDNFMIIRTAWLYSEFGKNFVKTMIQLGSKSDKLGVIFDQVGTPTYAYDLAVAVFAALEKGIVPGIYHFSNEGVISWYDFTKAIHRIAGITSCDVRPIHTSEYPTPAKRPRYSVLDKAKFKKTYGIRIPYWEDSLRRCIENMGRE